MNWRDPNKTLPETGQIVWIMSEPHKNRGSLRDSAMSILIACGYASYGSDGSCFVQNNDELGYGSSGWYLTSPTDDYRHEYNSAIAWLPLNEMSFPGENK